MDLVADLDLTKERGWSTNREEFTKGVISVGAPVFSGRTLPAGAICVDVPTARVLDEQVIEKIAAEVVNTAQLISSIGSNNNLE